MLSEGDLPRFWLDYKCGVGWNILYYMLACEPSFYMSVRVRGSGTIVGWSLVLLYLDEEKQIYERIRFCHMSIHMENGP